MSSLDLFLKLIEDERSTALTVRQAGVLSALAADPARAMDFSALSQLLNISKPCLTRAVDKLDAEGLADRGDDPDDRRKIIVRITAEGVKFAKRVGL